MVKTHPHREHHRLYPERSLRVAVLTISSSKTPRADVSGALLRRLLEARGHHVADYHIVPDRVPAIRRALLSGLRGADVVILTGGTGLTPDDVTVEAVRPLLTREIEGFGELFRMLSHRQVGSSAWLSRALAGLRGDRAIFCLPGSPEAVRLAMEKLILPELGHLLGLAR
ncbi:MAG: MogA/MoaB family molybdenum cofactor biosynthesis protein, partial [Euryarchaeota archaeon]|nr:MogA/MoaB family molybdenum cofactor biosynthesis protein [Euryarchaeota archaeon]